MGKSLHNKVNRTELRQRIRGEDTLRTTLSFYAYARIPEPVLFRNSFYQSLHELEVLGRIYVAHEGVNAQLSVPSQNLDIFKVYLDTFPFLKNIRLNIAVEDNGKSFFTLAIKVRDKIVADGLTDPDFDVTNSGVHLNAQEFNELAGEQDTIIVDMRNHYESEVGFFEKAVLPPMETFREGLPLVADLLKEEKDRNIIMYCTGGIRCEKASAYLKYKGFSHVYQLDGGIIEYARQVEKQGLPNKYIGKNFVFDERLGERISDDVVASCHLCRKSCDTHTNCANDACHLLFIQCPECAVDYAGCCSLQCKEFNLLPEDERKKRRAGMEFNGTKFSKSKPGLL
ncbi:MAG: rhodanese-related sulfurtransferase [Saprospiraceae bacterium]